jgi:RNA polymerase sigma factor (TIGR02999 family)
MDSASQVRVTQLLKAWSKGDPEALESLVPLVYHELRRMGRHYMNAERSGHTLDATSLVHEVFLRLVEGSEVEWQDRSHFFAVCARIMRRTLVDAARARGAGKRGGGVKKLDLDHAASVIDSRIDLIALDDALNALAEFDERKARVVELRYFAGLSVQETASLLKISPESVMRDWKLARAWLARELKAGSSTP